MGHAARLVAHWALAFAAAGSLAFGTRANAQVRPFGQPQRLAPAATPTAAVPAQTAAPVQAAPAVQPNSMFSQPASPPTINLAQGQLTIRATNSSLRSILDQLQTMTGTKIDGLSKDERVFGVYGPGNPQEVLASLLDGTGYNVVIAGQKADGAPREVTLSLETAVDATPQPTGTTQAAEEDDDDDAPVGAPFGSFPAEPQQQPQPTAQPAAQQPQQIRTPQQMLQELQQMREQAQQNQPQ